MTVKNLAWIRTIPGYGNRLYEALKSIQNQASTVEQQLNANPMGQPQAPPNIQGLNVQGQNGHFSLAITDNSEMYRGIRYYAEHDTDPQFSNPMPIELGAPRNHSVFLGAGTRYWRAYSAYPNGQRSAAVYFGSAAQPKGVDGGGAIGPPAALQSQGSGTGPAGVGLSGPGPVQYRSTSGRPPVR